MTAVLLAGCIAALSSGAVAAASNNVVPQSGKTYIVNLGRGSLLYPVDPETAAETAVGGRPSIGAAPAPSGVLLPDVSSYFDLDGNYGQGTYFTPRVQGFQLNLSGDQESGSAGGDGVGSQTYMVRPTSVGASFARDFRDVEISLGGDYGRTPKSVPGAVRLVDDHKLLRLGAHARTREFTVGGLIGSDIDPGNLGETLSWDAFSRYDFGALSIGLVYNYTIQIGDPSQDTGGMPGTLQGGVSYAFTPRMAITTNIAYGSYVNEDGGDDSGIAGVVGFSLDF